MAFRGEIAARCSPIVYSEVDDMDRGWIELPELDAWPNLLATRTQSGFSQGRLAAACKISQAQVSLFETGKHLPSLDQFIRLARRLEYSS